MSAKFFIFFRGFLPCDVYIDNREDISLCWITDTVAAAPFCVFSGGFGALRNLSKLIRFFMQKEVMTMNDYEMIMVVLGIIGLAIACLDSGVMIGSKNGRSPDLKQVCDLLVN